MVNVCSRCFRDRFAKNFIRQNGAPGDCDFCGSRKRRVIHAHRLHDLFSEVIGLYQAYEPPPGSEFWGGESLAECLAGWEIFPEEGDKRQQNGILDAIMGYDPHDADLSASDDWQAKSERWTANPMDQRWAWFADYLKSQRRFIIEEDSSGEIIRPEEWVPDLLDEASAFRQITTRTRLYRGRLGTAKTSTGGELPRLAKDMGAPPAKLATAGRANPAGISVVYCALEAETAIIETGRFPGAEISLRELRAKRPLRLADLRGKLSVLEPLDTTDLGDKIRIRTLLGSLGLALGEPIHPEDSSIEYIPTQYLAEVIRSAGYDGICYPSALNEAGTNVVVFDPEAVRITRRGWSFKLGRAEYTIHPKPEFSLRMKRRKRPGV
jgi:hypothetical protein